MGEGARPAPAPPLPSPPLPSPAFPSGRIDYSSVFRNTRHAHSCSRTDSKRGAMATGKTESDGQSLRLVFIEKEIKLRRKVVLLAPDLGINTCSVFLVRQEGGRSNVPNSRPPLPLGEISGLSRIPCASPRLEQGRRGGWINRGRCAKAHPVRTLVRVRVQRRVLGQVRAEAGSRVGGADLAPSGPPLLSTRAVVCIPPRAQTHTHRR